MSATCVWMSQLHRHTVHLTEALLMKCQPFYLLTEFSAVFIAAVYIPPKLDVETPLSSVYISAYETLHPDAIFIGFFKHCNLQSVLPKFITHFKIPTRKKSTLDYVYIKICVAYNDPISKAQTMSPTLLYPAYRQMLKQSTPTSKAIEFWSEETCAEGLLCTC